MSIGVTRDGRELELIATVAGPRPRMRVEEVAVSPFLAQRRAARDVQTDLQMALQLAQSASASQTRRMVWFASSLPFGVLALISVLSAVAFRGGLLLRLLGIAVVGSTGTDVSRGRAFARALLAWAPLAVPVIVYVGYSDVDFGRPGGVFLLGLGAIWAAFNPMRGLQDRIAGTYLVPR